MSLTYAVLNDVHIPNADSKVLKLCLSFLKRKEIKIDEIILNGDIVDCYPISTFIRKPFSASSIDLEIEELGKFIKELPTGNKDQAFSSLTADSDNAKNDILAMDRGEPVQLNPYDNHNYFIQSITHRIKKSDFRFLDPQIQDLYFQKLAQHELALQQQMQAIQQQNMGMIPSGGFLTTVNASWNNPATGRVERIKIPSEAVKWLVDKLNGQGAFAAEMAAIPPESQASVAGGAPAEESSLPPISQSQTEGAMTAAESQGV